jgi:hypothetical protein
MMSPYGTFDEVIGMISAQIAKGPYLFGSVSPRPRCCGAAL